MKTALKWSLWIAVSIPLTIYRGWCVQLLWLWFVVPLGFDPIGKAHALGLCLFMYLPNSGMVFQLQELDGMTDKRTINVLVGYFLVTTTALICGGLYRMLMS